MSKQSAPALPRSRDRGGGNSGNQYQQNGSDNYKGGIALPPIKRLIIGGCLIFIYGFYLVGALLFIFLVML